MEISRFIFLSRALVSTAAETLLHQLFKICSPVDKKKELSSIVFFLHFFCLTSFPLYFLERTAVRKSFKHWNSYSKLIIIIYNLLSLPLSECYHHRRRRNDRTFTKRQGERDIITTKRHYPKIFVFFLIKLTYSRDYSYERGWLWCDLCSLQLEVISNSRGRFARW